MHVEKFASPKQERSRLACTPDQDRVYLMAHRQGTSSMRLSTCLLSALLLGAAPPPPLATEAMGVFQTWGIHPKTSLSLVAGGLKVEVAAAPCQLPAQNEGCSFEGASNQAVVTVTQPGLPPFQMTSDRQASFVRIAVIDLAPEKGRSAVVVDNQWGGSAGTRPRCARSWSRKAI